MWHQQHQAAGGEHDPHRDVGATSAALRAGEQEPEHTQHQRDRPQQGANCPKRCRPACSPGWLAHRTGWFDSGFVGARRIRRGNLVDHRPIIAWPTRARPWIGRELAAVGWVRCTYHDWVIESRKRVLLAKPRGYCAGVDRAVQTVEEALKLYGAPIYVRKQIVHNKHVVSTLESLGAIFVEENAEVPEGATVVFSAHGVAPEVHEQARARQLRAIDATCPLVTKVHHEAKRFAAEDYDILLIGHEGHEEVIGTAGEAPEHIQLVDGPDSVDQVVVRDPEKVVWLSQTTLSVDETMETVARLKTRLPLLQSPPSDDICYATQNRQHVVKEIAPECDVIIVVGSTNSSNSVRLVEVAIDAGARGGHLVDYAAQIQDEWLDGAQTVGVSSGASVPEDLVMQVLAHLAERGFGEVTEVTTAEERLTFALPQELRRDMKAAGVRAGDN